MAASSCFTGRDRQILRLALPSIVANVTVPLLSLVDLAIVGHIGRASHIAAIAVGGMIFNVIYWIFGFLRMGSGGMTSQALGRRDLCEVVRVLLRSLGVGFVLGLVFIVAQRPVLESGLRLMHPDAGVLPLARSYVYICIWGAPAMLCLYGLTGWFVGMQNTRAPMVVSITQNVVNIVASLILVFVFHGGIAGVAAGTVLAQWCGLLLALLIVTLRYRRLWRGRRVGHVFTARAMRSFLAVNRDIFFRTLFLVGVFLSFTAAGSREGALMLAVNTLLMEFFTLFSYFTDGFAYAGEALCGRYYGASNRHAFREVVRRLFVFGAIITVAFTLLYSLGGRPFLRLLTSDGQVIAAAGPYVVWASAIPLAGIASFLLDGVFVGITHTRSLLLSSVVASCAFFVVWHAFGPTLGNHALWLAFLSFLSFRSLVNVMLYRRVGCSWAPR